MAPRIDGLAHHVTAHGCPYSGKSKGALPNTQAAAAADLMATLGLASPVT